jgi:tetratricopeptide (TPR) repeat protein
MAQRPQLNEKDPKKLLHLVPRINRARAEVNGRRARKAKELLDAILAEDPGNPAAMRLQAGALYQLERGQEALGLIDQLLEHSPTDQPLQISRARTLLLMGDFPGAELAAQQLLSEEPGSGPGIELQTQVLLRRVGPDEAARFLASHRRMHPEAAGAITELAYLEWTAERPAQALQLAQEALAVSPREAGAHAIQAEHLWHEAAREAGRGNRLAADSLRLLAQQTSQRALGLDPDEPLALTRYAESVRQTSDPRPAYGLYQAAIRRRPDLAEPHAGMAQLLQRLGQAPAALTHFGRACSLGYAEAGFYSNYGVTLAMTGQTQRARQIWEQALSLHPSREERDRIVQNLERLADR